MLDQYVDRLRALCAIDSPTGHRAGVDACAALVARWAEAIGCRVELIDSPLGSHLVATLSGPGAGRTLLVGHHDTVFPIGTGADRPLHVDGDHATGPGAADMKGGLLVALAALEQLAADPSPSHGTVELHSVPDEEARTVEPFALQRMRGATVSLVLECGRESGAIVSARKAGTWLALRAIGRAAHAGTEPDSGRSALLALCREAVRIERDVSRARDGVTAVVTQLRGGEAKNAVPATAEATVDLRALTADDLTWAMARVGDVALSDGIAITISDDRGFPPMTRAPALVAATLALLGELGSASGEEMAGGVSDASWTSHVGVPTVDGLGPVGGRDHTREEYIDLRSVEPRVAAVARLCRLVGGGFDPSDDGAARAQQNECGLVDGEA